MSFNQSLPQTENHSCIFRFAIFLKIGHRLFDFCPVEILSAAVFNFAYGFLFLTKKPNMGVEKLKEALVLTPLKFTQQAKDLEIKRLKLKEVHEVQDPFVQFAVIWLQY